MSPYVVFKVFAASFKILSFRKTRFFKFYVLEGKRFGKLPFNKFIHETCQGWAIKAIFLKTFQ